MTLIATVWSPEGFAIAADGLEVLTNPKGTTRDVQKIFSTPFVNDTGFAWAWVGDVGVEFMTGHSFDLKEITQRVTAELPDSPESYFDVIATRIHFEVSKGLNPSDLPDATTEAIFVGYLAGEPLWAEIIFQCREGIFLPPVVLEPKTSPEYFNAFSGSHTIRDKMQADGTLRQPLTLEKAVKAVRTYAETCVNSRGKVLDCSNFGGTIHIATVTKEGFKWIEKPKSFKNIKW